MFNVYAGPVSVDCINDMWVASIMTDSPYVPIPFDGRVHNVMVTGKRGMIAIHVDEEQVGGFLNTSEITEDDVISILSMMIGMQIT